MNRPRPRVLIAPDAFKGSLRSEEVAGAMSAGLKLASWPGTIETCLVGDGGDGTLSAFSHRGDGLMHRSVVRGPYGQPVEADWWMTDEKCAVIELARASGIALSDRREPLVASSFGTGELIRVALDAGADQVLLACGGSATVDGGIGLLSALGIRFCGVDGPWDDPRVEDLLSLTDIQVPKALEGLPIRVLTDVTNPLVGPEGAAAVFGPQKGLDLTGIPRVDACLQRLADQVGRQFGRSIAGRAGAGAAGGIAGALAGILGCPTVPGFDEISFRVGLQDAILRADVILTGEGQLDSQTWCGKTVAGVVGAARKADLGVFAFAGRIDDSAHAGCPPQVAVRAVTPPEMNFTEARPLAEALLTRAVAEETPRILEMALATNAPALG